MRCIAIDPSFPTTVIVACKLYLHHPSPLLALKEWFSFSPQTTPEACTRRIHSTLSKNPDFYFEKTEQDRILGKLNRFVVDRKVSHIFLGQARTGSGKLIYTRIRAELGGIVKLRTIPKPRKLVEYTAPIAYKPDTQFAWQTLWLALLCMDWPVATIEYMGKGDQRFVEHVLFPKPGDPINNERAARNWEDRYCPAAIKQAEDKEMQREERYQRYEEDLWANYPGGNPFKEP